MEPDTLGSTVTDALVAGDAEEVADGNPEVVGCEESEGVALNVLVIVGEGLSVRLFVHVSTSVAVEVLDPSIELLPLTVIVLDTLALVEGQTDVVEVLLCVGDDVTVLVPLGLVLK